MNGVYLAQGVQLVGDVTLGEDCSVWYNAVLRGDEAPITVGPRSNIQDNCVLHVDVDAPIHIGADVTVGHSAILHGCTIGDCSLVGMGSILLNGARIGRNVLIAAGSLIPQNAVIPDGVLVMGSPARVKRPLTPEELTSLKQSAEHYCHLAKAAKTTPERGGLN